MQLKVFRVRDNAKLPTRAHDGDAGMDFYYCSPQSSVRSIGINPIESILLPTGIKAEVPKGYMLEIKNKSGIASKKQLLVGACVVDSGYDGEIFVNLHNVGKQTHCEIVEVSDPSELNKDSTRGEGALGSTGSR